ncbi:hypothetical protein SAMCFNEI73_pB0133 (plasmid) [Sinorhizobium americanum]|uniref:Uncharacterized protein n=1 Tax=Sinorhizobium americanum TaxID=194963 RepID=A0A1L3LTE3_9HYPH|nr:hypothetical protein SAMCFNEI73_pB0133 [Sinorhizobium americanum]
MSTPLPPWETSSMGVTGFIDDIGIIAPPSVQSLSPPLLPV